MKIFIPLKFLLGVIFLTIFVPFPGPLFASCHSVRSPVVKDARKALDSKDVSWALKWVDKDRDLEIKNAFGRALEERETNPSKKEVTDQIFFETLLRVHCEGENIPYLEGVDPGQEQRDPLLEAMDRSLATGDVDNLVHMATKDIAKEIRERFAKVVALQPNQQDSIDVGRQYVGAYLNLEHYLESIKQQPKLKE